MALTGTERKVLLFLVGTLVIGLGLRFFRATAPAETFDYSASDSTFAVLSEQLENEETVAEDGSQEGKLNINTATKTQLMKLPGIGEVTAERILLYREEQGKFKSLEELLTIKGISDRKLNQLRPFIIVQ